MKLSENSRISGKTGRKLAFPWLKSTHKHSYPYSTCENDNL